MFAENGVTLEHLYSAAGYPATKVYTGIVSAKSKKESKSLADAVARHYNVNHEIEPLAIFLNYYISTFGNTIFSLEH
ncbi:MAG: hypothetical protein J5972_06585, partial [Eubacterium sp.]|nr:hypothetical protein [Eubacterium sp.]